jgi:hypothetical protein
MGEACDVSKVRWGSLKAAIVIAITSMMQLLLAWIYIGSEVVFAVFILFFWIICMYAVETFFSIRGIESKD